MHDESINQGLFCDTCMESLGELFGNFRNDILITKKVLLPIVRIHCSEYFCYAVEIPSCSSMDYAIHN